MADQPAPGTIAWHDLTVDDAPQLREFYSQVAAGPHSLGKSRFWVVRAPADAVLVLCQTEA